MTNNQTIVTIFNQAIQYTDQKQFDLAIQTYEQVISLQPNHAIAYNNMGILYNQSAHYQKAESCFARATQIDSNYANAWYNWGNTLKDQKNFHLAIEKFQKAISCKQSFAEAYNNMGECFEKDHQFDQSMAAFKKAITINPMLAGTFYNIGNLYYRKHQYDQAFKYFKHCIAIKPDYKNAHFHLSFTLLIQGDYLNGFKEYEWRLRRGPFTGDLFNQPLWDGKPALDKSLFVYSEQGFGDNFHFCRFLTMIAGKVKYLFFGARTEQVRLFKTIPGVDHVIGQGEKLPQFDLHCSLLSLPYLLQTSLQTIPCNIPYVFPDILEQDTPLNEMIEKQANGLLRIGIVWGGNPENKNDHNRSIPLSTMARLFSMKGIRWFSFQKGLHTKAIKEYETQVVDLSKYFNDFYDTALGLCQMDLLISVDTSVAHLAGALGIPVWLLIPPQPDWRWFLDQSDSPWYPTCHIFRKTDKDHDWQNVIEQVIQAIHEMISHTPNSWTKACFNEGLQHFHAKNDLLARVSFQKVISRYPISWEAENNLSGLFSKQGHRHNAILYGQRACRRQTQNVHLWTHLAKQYIQCGHFDKAIICYRQAQQLRDFTDARINYDTGHLLLLKGHWDEGLQWYEYRRQCDIIPERRQYDIPHWDGKPFPNKTLLLYSEFQGQSFIMYLRFAPLLKELGGTVVLESTPGMYRLAMNTLSVDRIFYFPNNQDSESVSAFDIQASLESLPYLLNIPKEAIPHDQPYLQPNIKFIPLERFIQSRAQKMKIGVSWFSEIADISKYLQIILQLLPIFDLDDISFFHIGHNPLLSIETIDIPDNLIDLSAFLDDSHDFASAIAQMDIIFSFDNIVGHLAGAMSKPVYMVIQKLHNWYWYLHTKQSEWYRSMTLFRASELLNDQALLKSMINKLTSESFKKNELTVDLPDDAIYLHAIGYFEGLTGCHIHTRFFFDAIDRYLPVLESDIQLPKRLACSIEYLNLEIVPKSKSVFNIAICPIHQLDMLASCPGLKIGYVVWESTSIPDDWMSSFSHTDFLWTPSQWFKQILINHGIDSQSIQVIPEGVNGQVFNCKGTQFKELTDIKAFKFLYVGKLEERKATPEMIVTFDYAFKDNPNVRLILASQKYKKEFNFNAYMQELGIRHPEKIICIGPFARHSELAALYRSCDAFVMPTRAEGWGLPIIEAMACGLPVIVTGYSGLTEFATQENAFLIDYKLVNIECPLGWQEKSNTTYYGQWAEPDFLHLSDTMQYVFRNQAEAKAVGQKASHDIHTQWTWNHAAKKAVDVLRALNK